MVGGAIGAGMMGLSLGRSAANTTKGAYQAAKGLTQKTGGLTRGALDAASKVIRRSRG